MAWTRAIYCGQYKRYGLTGGGTLTPYILIVKQAAAQIDSHCGIKSKHDGSSLAAVYVFV